MMKNFSLILILLGGFAIAQTIDVTGEVIDEFGALSDATVSVQGTDISATTDEDGFFELKGIDSSSILEVSHFDFPNQTVDVNGQTFLEINLSETDGSVQNLDEVVFIGYGSQSRALVTNAISTVDNEELVETATTSALGALQGRASGVSVTNTGGPGTNPYVTIRGLSTFGDSQPLIIVDGIPAGDLNNIPPESIESIDILKDASSTAIYGSRASNGVILIKTKTGKKGKPQVRYNSYIGFADAPETLDVLNANQYIDYAQSFDNYPSLQPGVVNPNINTNWQDEILQTGFWQNYNIEVAGGSDNARYALRSGYLSQEGALINTDFKRYNFGVNTSLDISDKIKVGQTFNLGISQSNNEQQSGDFSVLFNAIRFDPTKPVFDIPNNFYYELSTPEDGQDAENPVRILRNGSDVTKNYNILGSLFGSYEIVPGLTYKLTLGLDYIQSNRDAFSRSIPTGSRMRNDAITVKSRSTTVTTVITNTLTYDKSFGKHNFNILGGFERTAEDFDNTFSQTANSLTDDVENSNVNDVRALTSFRSEEFLHSAFGRVTYDFDKKYLFSASLRADGSSLFSEDFRWGYFPSVSGGVNFSRMSFLESSNTISNLKLRASWGLTGNNNIAAYSNQTGVSTDYNYVIGGALVSGGRPDTIPNSELEWEELTSYNIGADIGFLNNRLTFSVDYFRNESDGLLIEVPIRASAGSADGIQLQNVGGTEGTGLEFNIGYSDNKGDFRWNANLNAFYNISSEVTSTGNVDAVLPNVFIAQQNVNILRVGDAPLAFYGYKTDGVYQNAAEVAAGPSQAAPNDALGLIGNVRYVDVNGDGVINADDRTIIGDPTPDLTLGFDVNLNYKNWDFSLFLTGVYGNDIYNGVKHVLESQDRLFNTTPNVYNNRWTATNTSTSVPRTTPGFQANDFISDRHIEDGSFTRIRSITLGYTFDKNIFNGFVNSMRIYVTGQNLVTFTDYSGLDPEIVPSVGMNAASSIDRTANNDGRLFAQGIDFGGYPQPKTFLAGIQIQF